MFGRPPGSHRMALLFPSPPLCRSVRPRAAWLLLLAVVSRAVTLAARGYALRRDLLDHPGERRSHVVPTPRGGGIGIVLAMLVAMGLLAYGDSGQAVAMVLSAAGLLLVAEIGRAHV